MKKQLPVLCLIGMVILLVISCKKEDKTAVPGSKLSTDSSYGVVNGSYDITVWGGDFCGKRVSYEINFSNGSKPIRTYCSVGKVRINDFNFLPKVFYIDKNPFMYYQLPPSQNDSILDALWGSEPEFEMEGNSEFGFEPVTGKFKTPKIIKLFSPEPVDTNYYYLFPATKDYTIKWEPDSVNNEVQISVSNFGPWKDGDYPDHSDFENPGFSAKQADNGRFTISADFLKKYPFNSLFWISINRKSYLTTIKSGKRNVSFYWTSRSSLAFVTRP